MNLAKLSSNGQITVPIEIRRLLGLKSGDKLLFFQNQEGEIVLTNASGRALQKAQKAFADAADEMGIRDDDDVQNLVNDLRHGKK